MTESNDILAYPTSQSEIQTIEKNEEKQDSLGPSFDQDLTKVKNVKIHKIILENFLSFEHDEVIFDPEFSIITGPNGAGKSTIYQALKFVLGSNDYDGRYGKWADFIRSGANSALVQVHFEIDSQQYIIQRSVERNKAPTFAIQYPKTKKIQRTNVKTIRNFSQTIRIDPDNIFSFMSQGNIDSIKDFKEETLCNFVEVGIGVDILRHQILDQKQKIEALVRENTVLQARKENLTYQLVELEPKLKKLEKKKEFLQKLDLLEDELLWNQRKEILQAIQEKEQEILLQQTRCTNIALEIQKLEVEVSEKQTKINSENSLLEQIQTDLATKSARLQIITDEITKKTTEKNSIAEKIEDLSKEIELYTSDAKTCAIKMDASNKQLEQIEIKITNHEKELNTFQKEERELNKEFHTHQKILLEYQAKTSQKQNEIQRLEEITKRHQELEEEIARKIKDIKKIRNDLEAFSWFMKNPRSDLQSRMIVVSQKYESQITQITNDIQDLDKIYKEIIEKIEKTKHSVYDKEMPKPKAIQSMMQEIRERKLHCFGPLIDYISFDGLFQKAIASIFGSRVLNSFIAKDNETFAQLKNMAQRFRAQCNIYLERSNPLRKLAEPQNAGKNGIFGYMVNQIDYLNPDIAIKKVIYSVANRTLIVKDHITAINFVQNYNYDSWIVTLDGEQIRPKKLVIESRPHLTNKNQINFANVAQAKQYLIELNEKAEMNRKEVNQRKQLQLEKQNKRKILQTRLTQIEMLLTKYKLLEMGTLRKNKLISEREKAYHKMELVKKTCVNLDLELEKIKSNLPKETLSGQERLEILPHLIQNYQNELQQYQNTKTNYEEELQNLKIEKSTIDTSISLKNQEKETIETNLKKFDGEFFNLFKENMSLKTEIDTLKKEKTNLSHQLKEYIQSISILNKEISTKNFDKLKIDLNIEKIMEFISINQQKLDQIELTFRDKKTHFVQDRSFQEITTDIALIKKFIGNYRDIDDSILVSKEKIENSITRINEKREMIHEEIDAAQEAEKELEEAYYVKFEKSIIILEEAMNKKFSVAELNFRVQLKLKGEIKNLGLNINIFFKIDGEEMSYPLAALSGGQRSMVGICLMLSLNQLNPSPLNIYDECDMFLDEKNAQTVAKLVYQLAQSGVQFVILMPSKNKTLLQLANKVIGVSRNGKNGPSTVHYSRPMKRS
ncbi:AAA family ATPase [Candidatus Lokiarchaeum ossiferum]|uniref:AAA family ATPase n=1 Tax=Candidatus Lokiarchaeum ossiferum TaxID=2951803 RepID=UPI00352D9D03